MVTGPFAVRRLVLNTGEQSAAAGDKIRPPTAERIGIESRDAEWRHGI